MIVALSGHLLFTVTEFINIKILLINLIFRTIKTVLPVIEEYDVIRMLCDRLHA